MRNAIISKEGGWLDFACLELAERCLQDEGIHNPMMEQRLAVMIRDLIDNWIDGLEDYLHGPA